MVMDSKTLCDFCDSIDFGAVGFYGSDYEFLEDRELSLDSIFQSSERCIFCGKIAELFRQWSFRKFGNYAPSLENSKAFVGMYYLKSVELDDEFEPKGNLIRIMVQIMIKDPSPEVGWFGPDFQFQKCSQDPPRVLKLCSGDSLFDWESGQEQAYGGRIRPLVANTQLFRKWKELCCGIHGDVCNSNFGSKRPSLLRFIDVEDRCVVDNEDGSNYTALSYVWGKAALPMLKKETEEKFRKAGSLTQEMLPSTIDDAIEVTKNLGERYIWVDCLCIMQDDETDKNRFIPRMDSIFGFALVTIVAASGVDVEAGLPGIRLESRTREQVPFMIKGVSLLETLDSERLGDSVWLTRGWTLQEKLFSRRALIFTEEQVYWECQKASWCEDGLWETKKFPTIYRHSIHNVRDVEKFRHPWGTDVDSFEMIYRHLVEEYSKRKLSFASDILHAFAGVVEHFFEHCKQNFFWGLPTFFLSSALTWSSDSSAKRRLDCFSKTTSDGTIIMSPFPSWSWVGWVGEVEFFGNLNLETVDLIFYYLDHDNGLPEEIDSAAPTQSLTEIHVRTDNDQTIVTREHIPDQVLSRSKAESVLCFWSSTAKLHFGHWEDVDDDDDETNERGEKKPRLSHNGKVLPNTLHRLFYPPGHEELAEFVVIGKSKSDENSLELLLVEWEDGVAYRRGLVSIKILDWVELDNRVWKVVILG